MSVLFHVYIPYEEEDSALNSVPPEFLIEKFEDDDTNGSSKHDLDLLDGKLEDDFACKKPLLKSKSQQDFSGTLPGALELRRSSDNHLNPLVAKPSNVHSSQQLIKKGDKVRFQVVPAPEDELPRGSTQLLDTNVDGCASEVINSDSPEFVVERITFKEAVCEILSALKISNSVWQKTESKDQWRLEFDVDSSQSEQVLNRFMKFGIGRSPGTSVSLFPANVHYEKREGSSMAESERSAFVKSVKSRLTVTQVVLAVQSNARLTFDFLILIVLASIIAGLGLAESSSVVLVASMLISPLMGPIVGFTFGVVIRNQSLWRVSVRNELIGLSICLLYGFGFGLFTGAINNTGVRWNSSDSWPTAEMQARGMLRSLAVGVAIALPSGAGVALSILGGNTGSLVGVAISASLLPPAVNAGMLWGLAVVSAIAHPPYQDSTLLANHENLSACQLANNNYNFIYSCYMPSEAAILGCVSLLLTVLNIICIFFAGIVVLKIKEVAPHTALSEETEAFWKRDVPVMRTAYKTIKGSASLDLGKQAKQLIEELRAESVRNTGVNDVCQMVKKDPAYVEVTSRLPGHGVDFLDQVCQESSRQEQFSTVNDVEPMVYRTYHTVTDSKSARQAIARCTSYVATPTNDPTSPTMICPRSVLRLRRQSSSHHDDRSHREDVVADLIDVQQLENLSRNRSPSHCQRNLSCDNSTTSWIKSECAGNENQR